MDINQRYSILNANRITTKFGKTIILELKDYMFFLPKKYNSLKDETILQLKTEKFDLIKRLSDTDSSNVLDLLLGKTTTSTPPFNEPVENLPEYFQYYLP